LWETGADQQAGTLVGRLPAEGQFDLSVGNPGMRFDTGSGLSPTVVRLSWGWDSLN